MKDATIILGEANELMPDVETTSLDVGLVFTSPPYYNAKPEYAEYSSYEKYLDFLWSVFYECERLLLPGRFFVVNVSPVIQARESRQHESVRFNIPFDLHPLMTKLGLTLVDDIIWEKPAAAVKNRNAGFFQHRRPLAYKPNIVTEYILVYRKPDGKLIDQQLRACPPPILDASLVPDGYERTNVWKLRTKADKQHPAVFPLELAERVVRYYSLKGDLVLDPFMGSGTTAMAALRLGRRAHGYEREQRYHAVAMQRLGRLGL